MRPSKWLHTGSRSHCWSNDARTVVSSLRVGSALSNTPCAMLQVSTGLASRRREAPPQYSAWIYTLGRIRKKDAFAPSRRAFGAVPRRMRPPAKPKLPQSMPARPPPSVRDWAGRERPWSLDRRLAAPTPFSSVKSAALARKRWPISGKRQCLAKINIGLT